MPQPELELGNPSMCIWQGDIDTLLEPPSNCWVKIPRYIGGPQNKDSVIVNARPSLHLHQELSFDPSSAIVLSLYTSTT